MHIKEKVTGLWARRPRLSGTQGRALKGVAQFFAAMLVCTLIARGTAGATLAVVQTASPRRGELVQGLTADAALSAGEVQNVKAPTGLVLEKYFVPAGGRVEADTPLAQFDPDGVKDALARAKTELARLRLQREKLLAGDTALFRLYPAGQGTGGLQRPESAERRGRGRCPERCGYGSKRLGCGKCRAGGTAGTDGPARL